MWHNRKEIPEESNDNELRVRGSSVVNAASEYIDHDDIAHCDIADLNEDKQAFNDRSDSLNLQQHERNLKSIPETSGESESSNTVSNKSISKSACGPSDLSTVKNLVSSADCSSQCDQSFESNQGRQLIVKRKKRSSRLKANFNSDVNNNDLDGDIDSSGNEEAESSTDSSSDSLDLHATNNLTTFTSTATNDIDNGGNNIRRRKFGNRIFDRWRQDKSDRVDFIRSSAKLNRNEQDRSKNYQQKRLKMNDRKFPCVQSNNHNLQSNENSCSLSGTSKHNSNATKNTCYSLGHQPSHSYNNSDGTFIQRSLSCIKNLLSLSHNQQRDGDNFKCKQLAGSIKLRERKKVENTLETHETSTTTDEDNSPDMTGTVQDSYRTFKGSGRRHSRGSRNRRESQRSSQSIGYSKLDHHHYRTSNSNRYSFLQELKRFLLLLIIIVISCLFLWQIYELLIAEYNFLGVVDSPSKLGRYNKYAVSTDAKPCAEVGKALLAKGGSAVDAAIGTLLCMGVIIPNSLGIGGGCLMTIYDGKSKTATIIDGRETAPDYAHENMFANIPNNASRGPLSVAIPGELAAYAKAHELFGKLKWSELFEGSIRFAEDGHPMVEHMASALRNGNHVNYLTTAMAKMFINPVTRHYYQVGEVYAQPALANTLKRIRDFGVKDFYEGETGQKFIQDLKDQGGKITMENLSKYKPVVRQPLKQKLSDDLILHTLPPPGSGIVLSIILRVMLGLGYYDNLKPKESFEASSLYYHRLAEAFKFAYGQRAGLEDMPDNPERMQNLMQRLLSDQFIEEIVSKLDNKTHTNDYYGGLEYFKEDHGTAHVSVLDAEGNAASISTSINLYFGAGIYSPSTGITYNDVMDDFVVPGQSNKFGLAASIYNRIRPGKRPQSSMAPSIFTDSEGNVKLVVGGAGGAMITTGIASVTLRNCFLGDDIKTSIDAPRIHHQFLPNKIQYENDFPRDLLRSLRDDRNHVVEQIMGRSSVIMAIAADYTSNRTRVITANSDYRKGGTVDGL